MNDSPPTFLSTGCTSCSRVTIIAKGLPSRPKKLQFSSSLKANGSLGFNATFQKVTQNRFNVVSITDQYPPALVINTSASCIALLNSLPIAMGSPAIPPNTEHLHLVFWKWPPWHNDYNRKCIPALKHSHNFVFAYSTSAPCKTAVWFDGELLTKMIQPPCVLEALKQIVSSDY